jgi:hypothetical protein
MSSSPRRISNNTETTDHFVNEYRIRLVADRRLDAIPGGLWMAEYREQPIDDEHREPVAAPMLSKRGATTVSRRWRRWRRTRQSMILASYQKSNRRPLGGAAARRREDNDVSKAADMKNAA